MRVKHLSLTNFRNYGRLELALPEGAVLLFGANAQGKTNLLEAVYYLATTRSPHADQDSQLINWSGEDPFMPVTVGRLVAEVETSDRTRLLEMRLIKEREGKQSFRREALVDRRKVRLMDMLGQLRVVLFLPEDIQLITGAPAERRRYLDITLCQIDAHYCRQLSAYNKLLEQRNALLRQIGDTGKGRDLLPVYTERFVALAGYIFLRRAQFMNQLATEAQQIYYEALTGGSEAIRLRYLPRFVAPASGGKRYEDYVVAPLLKWADWLREEPEEQAVVAAFREQLMASTEEDIRRQSSGLGPHRDDWRFWLNGRNLSSYGSRGQQRTAMLALKMAEINWMHAESGEMPMLLLDDVVAELDERRRGLLLSYVQNGAQALLTATDTKMFPPLFREQATLFEVEAGRIKAVK